MVTVAVPVSEPLLAVTVEVAPLLGAVNTPAALIASGAGAPSERRLGRHCFAELV